MTVVQKAIKNRFKNCKLVMFSLNSSRFMKTESRNWRVGVLYLLYQLKIQFFVPPKITYKNNAKNFSNCIKVFAKPVDSPDQVLEL